METGRARLITRRRVEEHVTEIEGPPDWVMEVVSQRSVGRTPVCCAAAIAEPAFPSTG